MTVILTITFTVLSFLFSLFLITSFIHYTVNVYGNKNKTSVDPLVKKFAFVSLFGYTIFVVISFILYLIQSLYYIPTLNIKYTILICQTQTFNIVFFMTGKLSMYFYYMSLVHVAFRGSFLAYNPKIIGSMAICFFFLMCIIGGFYMVFLYMDFSAVGSITSPSDCDKFSASIGSIIAIWTGATCDCIWGFTCLLLFYIRLHKLTNIMSAQAKRERKETEEMIERIKSSNSETNNDTSTVTDPIINCKNRKIQLEIDNSDMIRPDGCTVSEYNMCRLENENEDSHIEIESDISTEEGVIEVEFDIDDIEDTIVSPIDEQIDSNNNITPKTPKYTLMKYSRSISSTSKIFTSIKMKFKKKKKIKRPSIVHKFLPIMLKLSILYALS
eukprot:501160_1